MCGGINLFGFEKEWQQKKKNDQYDSILNKLGFDANDLIVDQNNRYKKYYQKIYSWVC